MITETNQSETLTKHISCEYKCRFNRRKCNLDLWENLLASIMDDSAITCDEIIESYDEETNLMRESNL